MKGWMNGTAGALSLDPCGWELLLLAIDGMSSELFCSKFFGELYGIIWLTDCWYVIWRGLGEYTLFGLLQLFIGEMFNGWLIGLMQWSSWMFASTEGLLLRDSLRFYLIPIYFSEDPVPDLLLIMCYLLGEWLCCIIWEKWLAAACWAAKAYALRFECILYNS